MRRVVALLAAMAGLAAGACGSEETRLTQAEFVKEGNAICKAGGERIDAAAEKAFGDATEENPPSDEDITAFAKEEAIPEIDRQLGELDDLAPPKAAEAKLDEALKASRSALDKVKAKPAILVEESAEDPFEKANELLAAAGLESCSE